jgi:YesN/AraC family two-component response regulator
MEYSKDLNILYVEDNIEASLFTLEMLKRFCNNVTVAEDGKEGLKLFKKENFDIVLTDINMPHMSGLEMVAKIKKIDTTVAIIALSAHNETKYLDSSKNLNVDKYLFKPLKLNQFVETLIQIVEKIQKQKNNTK